ncbi:MAG: glycoside hydrolase family 2 TIM barrel-domain containing protein [Capsulimonas sp.]|uniref:glycoside hydrolase family 2 TIM barrel-domain containing protein n=1 Tax=Capsulimonas sp. TaxID=2494211 RepID=UPI00326401D2
MSIKVCLLATLLTASAAFSEPSRVAPASLPIPLPGSQPMRPDRLRAHNAWSLPMTGAWRFQLTHGQIVANQFVPVDKNSTANIDDFALPSYDDRRWDPIAVPSNWEMSGYSIPTYNSVDDTVGLYRRWVRVPKSFAGRRVVWRFDGALDGAEIFVNCKKAGYHESGYTAFDVDLTGLVEPGKRNLFAVRVSKSTPSVDADTGDFQSMGGIYRETSLIAVPKTHIQDITIDTPLDANGRDATLNADIQIAGEPGQEVELHGDVVGTDGAETSLRLLGSGRVGSDGAATVHLTAPAKSPKLWSAEKPNLYYLVLSLTSGGKTAERAQQRFGFRQVTIKNNMILWNGRPIKTTGVCRHDFWADKGFALTDKEWLKDLSMMKDANINAIRTSHYNHAARFMELCEEKGFYILDEVPFCWINEKNDDPAFAPALLIRAADTIGRDKNRPCVLAWSLGNENGVGKNSQTVIDFVQKLEPTRPAYISWGGPWGPKGQALEDRHYPPPADVDAYIKGDASKIPAAFTEQPHMFYQKEAVEYDPGVSDLWAETMIETWNKIWPAPTILGAFVWEWQGQGVADKNLDKTRDFYFGKDHLRQENNKGLVDSYRNPKPELWAVKMTYSPVAINSQTAAPTGGSCNVSLTNRYAFTDLQELTCRWTALKGEASLKAGTSHIAGVPGATVSAASPAPAGMTALKLEFVDAHGVSVNLTRLPAAGTALAAPPAGFSSAGGALTVQNTNDSLRIGDASSEIIFDKNTGAMRSWRVAGRDLLISGPTLNLGEAKGGEEKGYYKAAQAPILSGAVVTAQAQSGGSVRVSVAGDVLASAGGEKLGRLTETYDVRPGAQVFVAWTLDWTAPETHLWEAGLSLNVPASYSHMNWLRDSYFTVYPAGHIGEPSGKASAGDVSFHSSKRGLHWMTLTDRAGAGLELLAGETPLTARAAPSGNGVTLFASREVAGPKDLSIDWVAEHNIIATPGKPLSGSFVLRAIGK